MSVFSKKKFPSQYSPDVVSVIRLLSFKQATVVGSSSLVSQQNALDYDLHEDVKVGSVSEFVSKFQNLVRGLYHTTGVYLGDIKCGRVRDWEVIPPKAQVKKGKIVGFNYLTGRNKVEQLRKEGVISGEEYREAMGLLNDTSPEGFVRAKKELKFDVVRWKYTDVVAGFVVLRNGKTMDLATAIQTPSLCKVDCVAWTDRSRYTEFSCLYDVYVGTKHLNPVAEILSQSLKNDMLYLVNEGRFFKYARRLFAFARSRDDVKLGETLSTLFRSPLGTAYQVLGDLETLQWLIENEPRLNEGRIQTELKDMRERFLKAFPPSEAVPSEMEIVKSLRTMKSLPPRGSQFAKELAEVSEVLSEKVNGGAKEYLESVGLVPIPAKYGAGLT